MAEKRYALPRVDAMTLSEVHDLLESLQMVAYCEPDSQGSVFGRIAPNRSINGADFVDTITNLLDFYGLAPIEVKGEGK